MNKKVKEKIVYLGQDIITNKNFISQKEYLQHGFTNCYTHSLSVAYYSMILIQKLKIKVDHSSLVRGSLLHDYFLYDWHNPKHCPDWHAFKHPNIALINAKIEFSLNKIESDIISKHMFPLTFSIPNYKETIIVCIVDKFVSLLETFKLNNKLLTFLNN